MPERGSKPHKHVWLARATIPHKGGWHESYISGVFASQEAAVRLTRERLDARHGEPTESRWDDGDVYLYYPSGNKVVIQRYAVVV